MAALQRLIAELGITVRDPGVSGRRSRRVVLGSVCLVIGVVLTRMVGLLQTRCSSGRDARCRTLGRPDAYVRLLGGAGVRWASAIHASRGWVRRRTRARRGAANAAQKARLGRCRARRWLGPTTPPTNGDGPAGRRCVRCDRGCHLWRHPCARSPRDGLQPAPFNDVAFYAVLGRDLSVSGIESTMSASGLSEIPGTAGQTWYHWGEIWVAAAVIDLFGVLADRGALLVALPVVLLAAAALGGSVVRRWTRQTEPVFVFGFRPAYLLAPVALLPGPFFASWASGMIVRDHAVRAGAVAALIGLYCIAVATRSGGLVAGRSAGR